MAGLGWGRYGERESLVGAGRGMPLLFEKSRRKLLSLGERAFRALAGAAIVVATVVAGVGCGDGGEVAPAVAPVAATVVAVAPTIAVATPAIAAKAVAAATPAIAPPPVVVAPTVAVVATNTSVMGVKTTLPVLPPTPAPTTPTPQPSPTPAPTQPVPLPTPTTLPATPAPAATFGAAVDADGRVLSDPDYESALTAARLRPSEWDTDFSLHTVPYSEIRFVIPRDNIPSIDAPAFVSPDEAAEWLADVEPVVALEIDGDARAYPLQILTWHEIVNDEVGGLPVAVTFCPLCNSAIAFDRRLDGELLEFGVSGNLRNSDLVMYDRQTQSWWQQFTGEGIVGEYAGRNLEHLPSLLISFADFREAHPEGKVLSRETGYTRNYGVNPYIGYDTFSGTPFLFGGNLDDRLPPVERVIAVSAGGVDAAFPLSALQEMSVINYTLGDRDIVVFFKTGTASALDAAVIADARDVGSAAAFDAELNGRRLTFSAADGAIRDDETGSVWSISGRAVEGELAGASLTPLAHGNHFWFAWAAFKPDTLLYEGGDGG